MNRIATAAFVFALSASAWSQKIDTHADRGETLKVTVTGDIDFHYVHRNDDLTRAGAGGFGFGSTSNTFEGEIGVRLDIELSEKIAAVVSLRTQRVIGGSTVGLLNGTSGDDSHGSAGGTATPDVNAWGRNPETLNVFFDEASVTLNEMLTPGLRLSAGILPVTFDIRGKGSSFFFDPRHSSTFAKNLMGTSSGDTALGFSDELQPAGVHLVYAKDQVSLGLALLPAIIEAGPQGDDEAAYLLWFMYSLESIGKGSRVGAIVSWNQPGVFVLGNDNNLFTIGAGADIQGLLEGLELYFEIYFQFGNLDTIGDTEIDSRGFAMQLGGEFHLPNNDLGIWFGLNFKFVSGDDDVTDDRNTDFFSYENINDTMILEDQYTGLDLDTNYWTIQGSVGAAFTVGSGAMKNNLEVSLLFAFTQLAQEVLTVSGDDTNDIGHELDLRARLLVSRQLSFDVAFAVLFASEVLESVVGTESDNDDKLGYLWTAGTNLRY